MQTLFELGHTYFAGEYCCSTCNHETIVFIDTKYSIFGLMERDQKCSICKEQKSIVCDGNLILRYDWPDADNSPWQLQAGFMNEDQRYCKECSKVVKKDWRKILVLCSQCDGIMKYK